MIQLPLLHLYLTLKIGMLIGDCYLKFHQGIGVFIFTTGTRPKQAGNKGGSGRKQVVLDVCNTLPKLNVINLQNQDWSVELVYVVVQYNS